MIKSMHNNVVLVTLHGGCFVGGSSSWDKPQTELLRSIFYRVH